jgi:hypothetical protein
MENKVAKYESKTALIEETRNCEQRPILLEIDWDNEKIIVYTRDNDGSTDGNVWHGLASVYKLTPNIDATELREWVQSEILPRAEKLMSAFSAEWDGSNRKGQWKEIVSTGEDVGQLDAEISQLCGDDREVPQLRGDGPGLWDVREWAAVTLEECNKDTTDAEIETLAQRIESAADSDNVVLCGPDLREYLTSRRDDLKKDEE